LAVAIDSRHVVKRFSIRPDPSGAGPSQGGWRDQSGALRIAAIDFAPRQSRHLVLSDRDSSAATSAHPMLKDIEHD
jgi:hypothetical protein